MTLRYDFVSFSLALIVHSLLVFLTVLVYYLISILLCPHNDQDLLLLNYDSGVLGI